MADPAWVPTTLWDAVQFAGRPQEVVEGTVSGADWLATTAARLPGVAARLAALHEPGATTPGRVQCGRCRVDWPCQEARLLLGEMSMVPEDFDIVTEEMKR